MTLPTVSESCSSNANSSLGSKFSSIQCYLIIHSISSIYMKTKSRKVYPDNVVVIIYHPNLDMNILSDPFIHEKPMKCLLYDPHFSKKNKIPFSLWQNMNDSLILPLRLDLELSIMTNEQRIIIGRTTVNINQDQMELNDCFDVNIIPSQRKTGFWKSKISSKYSFKGYPECSYRFDNAKLRVRVEKISNSSIKSHSCSSPHDMTNAKIPSSIPVMLESVESGSQLTDHQYGSRKSLNSSQPSDCDERENTMMLTNLHENFQFNHKTPVPSNQDKVSKTIIMNSERIIHSPNQRTLSKSTQEKYMSITSPPAVNRLTSEPRKSSLICGKSHYTVEKSMTNHVLSSQSTSILPSLNYPKSSNQINVSSCCNDYPSKQNSIISDSVTDTFAAFGKQLQLLEEEVKKIEAEHTLLQQQHVHNHLEINEDARMQQHREIIKEAVRQVEQAQLAREEAERIARKKELEQYQETRKEQERNIIKNSKLSDTRVSLMSSVANMKDRKSSEWSCGVVG